MITAAIIAEYNPFHNGHAYLIQEARRVCQADRIIVMMSGNFVQRGEPAIVDKYVRTHMALLSGADVVMELPTIFATASAADFAEAGVRMAAACQADYLVFGSEKGISLAQLSDKASYDLRIEKDPDLQERIAALIRSGATYPEAVQKAAEEPFPEEIYSSNNVLAVEYIKAIHRHSYAVKPCAIARIGDDYSSANAVDARYTSATALRTILREEGDSTLRNYIPNEALDCLSNTTPVYPEDLSSILAIRILDRIRTMEGSHIDPYFTDISDVSREISDRILSAAYMHLNYTEMAQYVKTRQYTYTRISRCLLHIVLNIGTDRVERLKKEGWIKYLRILGFRSDSTDVLKEIKQHTELPIITKTANFKELLADDIYASELYYHLQAEKGCKVRSEYERSPIML